MRQISAGLAFLKFVYYDTVPRRGLAGRRPESRAPAWNRVHYYYGTKLSRYFVGVGIIIELTPWAARHNSILAFPRPSLGLRGEHYAFIIQ